MKTKELAGVQEKLQDIDQGEQRGKGGQISKTWENLSAQAQKSIAGTMEPEEAWRLLDKLYGNKSITIMLAIHRIETLRLTHDPDHDKVSKLKQ